jgi:hypothetical protein
MYILPIDLNMDVCEPNSHVYGTVAPADNVIELEIVHSEPANWTGSHLSALHTQPYTTYDPDKTVSLRPGTPIDTPMCNVCRCSLGVKRL